MYTHKEVVSANLILGSHISLYSQRQHTMQHGISVLKPLMEIKTIAFRLPNLCHRQVGSAGIRKSSWNVAKLLSRSEIAHQCSP